MPTTPPTLTSAPDAPDKYGTSRTVFDAAMQAMLNWMGPFVTQMNAALAWVAARLDEIAAYATQTGLDAAATAADRIQTGADRSASSASATDAGISAATSLALKTQTETARDAAIAGLGAADNSQALSELLNSIAYAIDLAAHAAQVSGGVGTSITDLYTNLEESVQAISHALDLAGQAAKAVSGGDVLLRAGSAVNPSLQSFGDPNTGLFFPSADSVALATGGVARITFDSSGHAATGTDNAQTLGTAAKRWSTVYAGTGSINTSDAREKTAVALLTTSEILAAKDLSRAVGSYKFLASIAAKGAAARSHIGLTVQQAIQIMQSHGLDPFAYGFICFDAWPEKTIEHAALAAVPDTVDEDGTVIQQGRSAVPAWTEIVQTAGDQFAFRYDQLSLFIAAGLNARLSTLENT